MYLSVECSRARRGTRILDCDRKDVHAICRLHRVLQNGDSLICADWETGTGRAWVHDVFHTREMLGEVGNQLIQSSFFWVAYRGSDAIVGPVDRMWWRHGSLLLPIKKGLEWVGVLSLESPLVQNFWSNICVCVPKMDMHFVSELSVGCQWDIRVASRSRRVGGSPHGRWTDKYMTIHGPVSDSVIFLSCHVLVSDLSV
jgi:hypothetical protein